MRRDPNNAKKRREELSARENVEKIL